jgi:hypothetical protein
MSIQRSAAARALFRASEAQNSHICAPFRSAVFASARSVPIRAVRRWSQLPPSQSATVQSLARPSLRRRTTKTTLEGCMKRQIIFGTMLSAALAVGVAAQQPPSAPGQPPSTPSTSSSQSQSDSAKTVTMTGCLQAASSSGGGAAAQPGAPGAPGAGAGASQAKSFILASASPAGSASKEPGAPGAPAATAGTSGSGSTYRLTGGDDQNLEKYIGQRVEVTGRLSGRSAGSSSGAGAPGAGAGASGSSQSGPALSVSSVRSTGESCK